MPAGGGGFMATANHAGNPINDGATPKMADEILQFSEKLKRFFLEVLEAFRYLLEQGIRKSWNRVKEEVAFLWKRFTAFDFVCGNLSLAALGASILVFFSGFGVLGYQIFLWLKDGVWTEFPLMKAFNYFFENTALQEWVQNPSSWLGLHQLVEWNLINIPISLVLIVNGIGGIGFMIFVISSALLIRRFQFKHREA